MTELNLKHGGCCFMVHANQSQIRSSSSKSRISSFVPVPTRTNELFLKRVRTSSSKVGLSIGMHMTRAMLLLSLRQRMRIGLGFSWLSGYGNVLAGTVEQTFRASHSCPGALSSLETFVRTDAISFTASHT
jgi:hypothetical protein